MSKKILPGSNLPGFVATQLDFAAYIRNPDKHDLPCDIEARRMQIYVDLFFNNVLGFVSSTFPVLKSLMPDARWQKLVRDFFDLHGSESPYFLQVSEEFLTFLSDVPQPDLPKFVLELAHYEWVEMALDVASDVDLPELDPVTQASRYLYVSPFVRCLTYTYPVHEIGPKHQPAQPGPNETHLLVYRTADEEVRFMQSNPITFRLLGLLQEQALEDSIACIHDELVKAGVTLSLEQVDAQSRTLVADLVAKDIILGELRQS